MTALTAPARAVGRIIPIQSSNVRPFGIKWRSHPVFIILTVGVGMFSDLFLYAIMVPVFPFLLRDRLHAKESQIQDLVDLLLSIYAAASMVASPIAGYLADKMASTRQVPFLLGLGALFASTVLLAVGDSVPVLAIARLLQGASSGLVWTIGLAICLETVGPENMGKTVGSIFSSLTAATLLGPILGGTLYEKTGYKGVFGVSAAILLIDLILRLLVIEKKVADMYIDSDTPPTSPVDSATTAGDGMDEETTLLPKQHDAAYELAIPSSKFLQRNPILICLTNKSLLVACLIGWAQAFFLGTFDATIPILASDWYGLTSLHSGLLFMPLALMDLITGPPSGWAIDHYGTKPASVIGFSFLGIAYMLLRLASPGGQHEIIIYCVLLALCGIGISISGPPGIVEAGDIMEKYHKANPELFGETGPYGQLYGISSMTFSLGLTLGPVAAGSMKNLIGYANMNSVMGGISFVLAVLTFFYIGGAPGDMRVVKWLRRSWSRA